MFPNDLNNVYPYECERRKDEMREAAQSNLLSEFRREGQSSRWMLAGLSILALLLAVSLNACSTQIVQTQLEEKSAIYQTVLGKSLNDKEVVNFIAINNCSLAAEYQLCKDAGIAFWGDSNWIVKMVYLYSGNTDGFRRYRGELPFGLSFYDPMWRV